MLMQNGNQVGRNLRALIALAALSAIAAQAPAGPRDLPPPRDYVEDRAGVIDAGVRSKLNRYLAELEQKTGAQMVVLTIPSTEGIPVEPFAIELAQHWKLGQKGKDNGVLVLIAVNDKRGRIEVGYGLEPVLPDGFCGSVGRNVIRPAFADANYSKHVYDAALILANKVAGAGGVKISGMPQRGLPASQGGRIHAYAPCCSFVIPLIIIMILLSAMTRRHRGYRRWGYGGGPRWLWFLLGSTMFSGRRYGGWGGGGFGGGFGGGSFGGGGGGSFGGGGASF
jgi:uncharacterized protein